MKFDLEAFYQSCESGEKVDFSGVIQYIKSFESVIIWGSAGLGQAIGRFLEEQHVKNLIYWDQRYQEIGPIKGRRIQAPFSEEYDRNTTLVMYSIPNHVIMRELMNDLKTNGYLHVIRGDIFYSGTLCPYCNGSTPDAKKCWMAGECRSVICKRLQNITRYRSDSEKIELTYNCFIINSVCNLNCRDCVQYINNYPDNKHVNIPTDHIVRDIHAWLDLIDSVGTISTMGGETFMHPGIAEIAKAFSMHSNFGFVSSRPMACFQSRKNSWRE